MSDHPRASRNEKEAGNSANPDGQTPHGVPDDARQDEPTGLPNSDRHESETAPLKRK